MENLLEQLIERWEQAFDELEALPYHKALVKTTQYADGWRYRLEKFELDHFPGNGSMVKDKDSIDGGMLYEYGFNAEGLPCYVTFRHDYNQVTWEGFYTYSESHVEYIEFCLNTGVPSVLTRVTYREGRKVFFQHLAINGGGSGYAYSEMNKKEIVNAIKNDGFSLISTVKRYEYGHTDRIEKAFNMHTTPGIGKFTSYDEYTYDENQNLDTIRTFFEQGTSRLTYCRIPEMMTPESLTESLAEAMARSIADILAKQDLIQPIALLELSYHYADVYIPLLVWKSAREVEEQSAREAFDFINKYHDAVQVEILPFEQLFAQLEQMMDERGNTGMGSTMLRKAAYLLTRNKLFGKVKVSDDFAAYAIDWSIEGHSHADLEEILLECGLGEDVIETWKQKGMLPGLEQDL
jgi:hypothetical protein